MIVANSGLFSIAWGGLAAAHQSLLGDAANNDCYDTWKRQTMPAVCGTAT